MAPDALRTSRLEAAFPPSCAGLTRASTSFEPEPRHGWPGQARPWRPRNTDAIGNSSNVFLVIVCFRQNLDPEDAAVARLDLLAHSLDAGRIILHHIDSAARFSPGLLPDQSPPPAQPS